MVEIVAVAVVEGEAGEGCVILVGKCRRQIVERDEAIAVPLQSGDGRIEKFRGDFEMGVRIEGPRNPRPDVMQGEDGAAAARIRHQAGTAQTTCQLEPAGNRRASRPRPDTCRDAARHVSPFKSAFGNNCRTP
ncbi:hypothetical protein D3C80_1656740 [compost metagenome]